MDRGLHSADLDHAGGAYPAREQVRRFGPRIHALGDRDDLSCEISQCSLGAVGVEAGTGYDCKGRIDVYAGSAPRIQHECAAAEILFDDPLDEPLREAGVVRVPIAALLW